jgi:hypothetical protein
VHNITLLNSTIDSSFALVRFKHDDVYAEWISIIGILLALTAGHGSRAVFRPVHITRARATAYTHYE